MKALCIGQTAYNIMAISSEFPMENTKNKFEKIEESGGGCAAIMSYMLGKYGVESYIGSSVGDDTYGTLVKKELEKVGVHTEYMETAYEKRTSSSFILIGQKNNSRTIYDVTKEPLFLKKTEFQMEPDLVIVDGYDYGASQAALNKFASKITIIDAGMYNKEIMELCKAVQYIVASKEFAEAVSGSRINFENPGSLVTVYSALVNKFPGKTIIVTLEDKGAMYMAGNQIKVMPGLSLKTVDSTGAGDAFHAAFGYALLQGYDMERAITFANIAGGLMTTKIGGLTAIPDLSDIMTYYNQKYGEVDAKIAAAENAPAATSQVASAPDANVATPTAAAPTTEAPAVPQTPQASVAPTPGVATAPVPPVAPVAPVVTPAAPVTSAAPAPAVGPAVTPVAPQNQTPPNPPVA